MFFCRSMGGRSSPGTRGPVSGNPEVAQHGSTRAMSRPSTPGPSTPRSSSRPGRSSSTRSPPPRVDPHGSESGRRTMSRTRRSRAGGTMAEAALAAVHRRQAMRDRGVIAFSSPHALSWNCSGPVYPEPHQDSPTDCTPRHPSSDPLPRGRTDKYLLLAHTYNFQNRPQNACTRNSCRRGGIAPRFTDAQNRSGSLHSS